VSGDFKPPKCPPSRHSHLERLLGDYSKARGIAPDRTRRWVSTMTLIGALERVQDDDGPCFLIKGGVSMELRLGVAARATRDVDIVFRGPAAELLEVLDEAFEQPYSGFEFRRKDEPVEIRDTGSRRLSIQVSFQRKDWQTLIAEIASPESDEAELVPPAISLADFMLDSPKRVACLSLRYQIAQKIHAVTEQPADGRVNLRHRDLIDILLLRELVEDPRAVREACHEVFRIRAKQAWPPRLHTPAAWEAPFAVLATELKFAIIDVHVAAEQVRTLIALIETGAPIRRSNASKP
jgi:Nucleotidyl transferase AbiEii toxin, Type IV TA system